MVRTLVAGIPVPKAESLVNGRGRHCDQETGGVVMPESLAAIWDHIPLALSVGFIGLMLFGFWRGLRTKPRPDYEHAPERSHGGGG
jgi:hypothetical protein